jgi:hypothetical protein
MVGTVGTVGVDVDGEANVPVTLSAATGAVGTLTFIFGMKVFPTGQSATGSVGTVTFDAAANVSLTGVSATAGEPMINVWGLIDDSQDPSWSAVNDSQDPSWTAVSDSQDPAWEEVA